MITNIKIAIVIPCYKVNRHIVDLLSKISQEIYKIYVIDDACPFLSGKIVLQQCKDPRISVFFHEFNQGVGAAVLTGYQLAINDGADIIVKIDGDGQMNPALIPSFVTPIVMGQADYTKGNRFINFANLKNMPMIRLLGNSILSFISKISSGYWDIFDPTNGFTAIHSDVAKKLCFSEISKRFFFESDLLFRLYIIRAVVVDIPMDAIYGDEKSNLSILKILPEFVISHLKNLFKRIFYNYYLRDFCLASIELPLGILLFGGGVFIGVKNWIHSNAHDFPSTAGTVMLASLPIIIGFQLILSFLSFDINSVPKRTISKNISSITE